MKKTNTNTLSLLEDASGLTTLNDFKTALQNGDIDSAKKWLQFIIDNRTILNMLSKHWDNWIQIRKNEINNAEKNLKAN